ncbi:MAG TPA: hypothetical protein VKJ65_14240 [Phycisphaerae bacterium]|nr:hypothetical protein [Phycisphaerae bacterium]
MQTGLRCAILAAFAGLILIAAGCAGPLASDQAIAPLHSVAIDKSLAGVWQFTSKKHGDQSTFVLTLVIYPLDDNQFLINWFTWNIDNDGSWENPSLDATMRAWQLDINGQTCLNCQIFLPTLMTDPAHLANDLKHFASDTDTSAYDAALNRSIAQALTNGGFAHIYILALVDRVQRDSVDIYPLMDPGKQKNSPLPPNGFQSGKDLEQFLLSPAGQKLLSAKVNFGDDAMRFVRIDPQSLPKQIGGTSDAF